MNETRKVILDADGVLFDERPYWDAALAVALEANDIPTPDAQRFRQMADIAFEEFDLQQTAKRFGCNSNWDLAAMLATAIGSGADRRRIVEKLAGGALREAMAGVATAVHQRWPAPASTIRPDETGTVDDPLARIGIDRRGDDFRRWRRLFDDWLGRRLAASDGTSAPCETCEPVAQQRRALQRLRKIGYELWVCTGRSRNEILTPLRNVGLGDLLEPGRVVSQNEVERGQQRASGAFLGKPHWFPVACAAIGFDAALERLKAQRTSSMAAPSIYVGDALADFRSAVACAAAGVPTVFVHVRSGVTSPAQSSAIASSPATIASIDRLSQLPAILRSFT